MCVTLGICIHTLTHFSFLARFLLFGNKVVVFNSGCFSTKSELSMGNRGGHSKTRTSVQLGILLGLSGDSGDGMERGGSGDGILGGWGRGCVMH